MRRAIYDRAREEAMLSAPPEGLHPRMPESFDITREEIALNQAIALVEAKFDADGSRSAKPDGRQASAARRGVSRSDRSGCVSKARAALGQPSNLKSVPSSLAESAPAAPLLRGPATAPPSPGSPTSAPGPAHPALRPTLAKVVPPADAHASRSLCGRAQHRALARGGPRS